MNVRALLFASLAETAGAREVELELAPGATVSDALDALVREHPDLAGARPTLATAVNARYAPTATRLHPGDVVALIPPVSGG